MVSARHLTSSASHPAELPQPLFEGMMPSKIKEFPPPDAVILTPEAAPDSVQPDIECDVVLYDGPKGRSAFRSALTPTPA